MRRPSVIPLVLLLVACSTPPVYLDDLEASDLASVDAVIERLSCNSYITTFHLGEGVNNESEALEVARAEGDREMRVLIERAELRGAHVWVLTTETGQVIGALDDRGGISICDLDVKGIDQ
ncbi:MAG TPA: hypothetical protein VFL72_01265 [Acidimicrobiia bacterium]|nr:hypothetical protein [Acidimicrobiia bacterium]